MDEVIKREVHYQEHTGVLTHKTSQPTESIILKRNAELRKDPGSMRDLGSNEAGGAFGRQVASIPFIMYEEAIRNGFELNSKDSKHAGLETMRFLRSEEGQLCLTQGKV